MKKPTLRAISNPALHMNFDKFNFFEVLLKLTPEIFYTKFREKDGGKEYWDALSNEKKESITLYDLILTDEDLRGQFVELFDFFFVEHVIFKDGFFILSNVEIDPEQEINAEDITGIITPELFPHILDLMQQICCIKEKEEPPPKFKNKLAKTMWERMQKAEKKRKVKNDINLTLPNIISSVAAKHSSYNLSNIWDLTVFQLMDTFNRMQVETVYNIDCTRVSVWGDEKKKFDIALWYKNEYDKK